MTKSVWKIIFAILITTIFVSTARAAPEEERFRVADSFFKTNNYLKARKLYREIYLSEGEGALSEEAMFRMIKCDGNLHRYLEVYLNLIRFMKAYPSSPNLDEAHFLMGYALYNMGRSDDADRYLRDVRGALKAHAALLRAGIAVDAREIQQAEILLNYADGRVYEKDPWALFIKAKVLSHLGKGIEALETVDELSEVTLAEPGFLVQKAEIFKRMKRFSDAKDLLRKIISGSPMNMDRLNARKLLLDIYLEEGNITQALSMADRLILHLSDDFKMRMAELHKSRGDLMSSLRYISYVKERKRASAAVKKELSAIIESGSTEMVGLVTRFSGYIDRDDPFFVDVAKYLADRGMVDEAMVRLRKALQGKSKSYASLVVAKIYFQDGKYDKAERLLQYLIYDMRFASEALLLKSRIMEKGKNYEAAIIYLKKSLKLKETPEVYEKIGDLSYASGDRAGALEHYVIASGKGNKNALVKAGDCLYLMGNPRESISYYEKALRSGKLDEEQIQWAQYQYGKLTGKWDFLREAAEGGGVVGESAKILAGRSRDR